MDTSWTAQLINRTVEAVEQWEALPCVVQLSGGYRVQIESLWQLVSGTALVLTSRDEGQLFGRSSPVLAMSELATHLAGQVLSSVKIEPRTADLTLVFHDSELQVVSDSSGYEAWQVEGPQGTVAVGQGGGNVAVWG
jgi:hypothetical protein